MLKKGGLVVVAFILSGVLAYADIVDTIIPINAVVTKGVKFDKYSAGTKVISIDTFQHSLYQMNSVAELLSYQSLVNISAYGPGGLAALKMRGGSADHTTIVWNGINIKPPMSGELNLSGLNAGVIDNISIQPGGASTMYGTGATTGVVYLSNRLKLNNEGLNGQLGYEYGSAETKGITARGGYSGKAFGTRLGVSYQDSENNFEFINTDRFGDPKEKQEHAAYNTISVFQQNAFRIGETMKFETDVWYSNHFKEIPSSTSSALPGTNNQRDENVYFVLNMSKYGNNWFVKYRGGMLYYSINYLGYYGEESRRSINKSWSYINEVEAKYSLKKNHKLFIGINSTIDHAEVTDYTEAPWRNNLDVFGRYSSSLFNNYLKLNFEARQATVDYEFIPVVYSGGTEVKMVNSTSVKLSAAKVYNMPDLNDLYWANTGMAAGNPDLKPEFGWNSEGGLIFNHTLNNLNFNHEITYYRSELNDAISWIEDSTGVWKPRNYKHSKTNGFEFTGSTIYKFRSSVFKFSYDYSYINARVQDQTSDRNNYELKRYVPKHKAGFRVHYIYSRLTSAAYLQYVDEQPVDETGNALDRYFLVDLNINYQFDIREADLSVYIKLTNLLNTNYKLRAGYAQPLRGIYGGIKLKL